MKHLFSILTVILLVFTAKAQNPSPLPCISTWYVINNAGDGTMVVTFSSPLPTPESAPVVLSLAGLNGTFTWVASVTGKSSTTLSAYYVYHAGSDGKKLNNGNGSELHYSISIQYTGYDAQTCDAINTPPPSTLPVKFVSLKATPLGENIVQVDFEIAESTNVKLYNIQTSKDGINWKTVTIVFPDNLQPNRLYSVKIDLSTSNK